MMFTQGQSKQPDRDRLQASHLSSPDSTAPSSDITHDVRGPLRPTVKLVEGNLLDQQVDAIVNAWNRNFLPHRWLLTQGVSAAIKRAAGIKIFDDLQSFGVLPLGAARLTGAGELPYKGIIHVAGINYAWRSSEYSIRESVKNALTIACNERYESVAFPAIGAGSTLKFGNFEIPLWGVSESRSLRLIAETAAGCEYGGKVIVVKYRKGLR